MLNYSEISTVTSQSDNNKSAIHRELLSILYVFGIVGSSIALLHLSQSKTFKNSKQVFMLKCLMTLDLVGLCGMLCQVIFTYIHAGFYQDHIWMFCFILIVWRFFGMSSGCLAFIMAIERYFALTKPFFYCKHFTNGFIKRLIFWMWTSCAVLTFAPVFGFGIFCDAVGRKCERYRDAKDPADVIYAFVFFLVGTLLCIFMVLCNLSVTRIVYNSYRHMQQLTLSLRSNENLQGCQPSINFKHKNSVVSRSSFSTSKSISLITQEEIRFINMCNMLTASFVLCWGTQMITIPIAQLSAHANQSKAIRIYFQIADFLLLFHFAMDPYIYVLLRTNYWIRFKCFVGQRLFHKAEDDFINLPEKDPDQHF